MSAPAPNRNVFDHLVRNNLENFIIRCFMTLNPTTEYLPNWHISLLADRLEKCFRGECTRQLIMLPPRSLKSICVSVAFAAWVLGHDPSRRIVCASYSADLSLKLARDCRRIIESEWYCRIFPQTRIGGGKNSEEEFETTRNGSRFATSVGGVLTGRGGDILIIDDPMKPQDAYSDAKRRSTNEWYDNTLYSRLDDKKNGVIIMIIQRLHVDDLAAHVQEGESWEVLKLPAIAESAERFELADGRIIERAEGEALHAERESLESLAQTRRTMTSHFFSAQHQQNPVMPEGNLVKRDSVQRYDQLPERSSRDQTILSVDTAYKPDQHADYSVITVSRVQKEDVYLQDVIRGRYGFPELKRRVIQVHNKYKSDGILIEDKGSGTSLIQELKHERLPAIAIKVQDDKLTRMHAALIMFEAGQVYLPNSASWLTDFEDELFSFPHGRHDDQADSVSQLLNWVREKRLHAPPPLVDLNFPRLMRPSHFVGAV